jgi:hypothetical protein
MPHFFVNNHAQDNGTHEVHEVGCAKMPMDKGYLGNFESIGDALIEARKEYWHAGRCVRCELKAIERTATANRKIPSPLEQTARSFGPMWTRFR